jgi:hypothetical protein
MDEPLADVELSGDALVVYDLLASRVDLALPLPLVVEQDAP